MLLASTLLAGIAGAYELTASNKYCSLLVDDASQLAPYLTSFSVVFNVGKLVGPLLGGWLVALTGPAWALTIDAASYLLAHRQCDLLAETTAGAGAAQHTWQDSQPAAWPGGSVAAPCAVCWCFTALMCVVGFFHPGLGPLDRSPRTGDQHPWTWPCSPACWPCREHRGRDRASTQQPPLLQQTLADAGQASD